jgi:peptide/nickel transport system permease protein
VARLPRAPARHGEAEERRRRRGRLDGHLTMLNYLIRRIGYGVLILIGVNLFTFVLFFTVNTPDDMARLNIGGKRVTQDQIEKWKAERGYDKPLYWNKQEEGAAKLTKTIVWERSVWLLSVDFGVW